MSDLTPPPESLPEPTTGLPAFDGEVVGPPEQPAKGGSGRRLAVIGAVAVVVAAALGGAAFAAYQFLDGGGPRPEEALPDSTLAVISIDLDPRAGQKIEAIKTLRKFPALKESIGLKSQDDLRKYIVEEGVKAGDCDDLDYDADVEPWVGKRAAFAAVDVAGATAPAVALQIGDPAKAKAGMKKIADCIDADDFFYAVGEEFVIASDSQSHADTILAGGEKKSLADDAAYQKWTDRVGEQGVVNFYVSKKAADVMADLVESFFDEMVGGGFERGPSTDRLGEGDPYDEPSDYESFEDATAGAAAPSLAGTAGDDPTELIRDALKSFQGLAGTIRFADGGMELEVVSGGVSGIEGADEPRPVGDAVGDLPADTALVLGYGIPEDFAEQLVTGLEGDPMFDDFLNEMETDTGLDLPDDLQTLLGKAITLSLGGDAPGRLDEDFSPEDLPIGLVLHTDPEKAEEIIETAEENLGLRLADLPVTTEKSDSTLVLSPSPEYARELTEKGTLGETEAFRKAVPNADDAAVIFFTTLGEDWRETIADLAASDLSPSEVDDLEENLTPLEAVGLSASTDDDQGVFVLRISTR